MHWSGQPLVSHAVIVNLIAGTRTSMGLQGKCSMDYNTYPKGVTVSAEEYEAINLSRDPFHGEWNYTISPSTHLK
jgi:hypothetical protein